MKIYYPFLTLVLLGSCMLSNAQIPLNSRKFVVENYFYLDDDGNYTKYRAVGFSTPRTEQTKGRVFLLPVLTRDLKEIKFIAENGKMFTLADTSSQLARTIIIPVKIKAELPSVSELPAVASVLELGISQRNYIPPIAKGPKNSLLVSPGLQNQQAYNIIFNTAAIHAEKYEKQQAIADLYKNYQVEVASLSGMEISLMIDNETVAVSGFENNYITSGNFLGKIEIVHPSMYVQNRISEGNFSIDVSYKFRDASTSSINARFDVKEIIDDFLMETQRSMQSNSSSGWQVLGIGSRRQTLKTSFDNMVRRNYSEKNYQSTVIEMYDANDDLIAEFERDFFPEISKQKVIENHIKAAENAGIEGKDDLKKLHLDYARAIQNNNPDMEVDISKAIASLAAEDYAGFIAHGVRWGDHLSRGNSSFRRVVKESSEIDTKRHWIQQRNVSIQHSLTQMVGEEDKKKRYASIGLYDASSWNWQVKERNTSGANNTRIVSGLMINAVYEDAPLSLSGIMPGNFVFSINDEDFSTVSKLHDLLEKYNPGDEVIFKVIFPGQETFHEVKVRLKAGLPRN